MTIDFILPDIGEGIVECELVEWLVKEGDVIAEDQPIADVMTDKALVQIPAMHAGIIEKLHYQQGEIAKVHAPLFSMKVANDQTSDTSTKQNTVIEKQPAVLAEIADKQAIIEDFILPDIGEGIVECELVEWLVKEGDVITEDQPIADVMTDKALVQIPAMHAGIVSKLYYQQGEIAKVHAPLFAIEIQGEVALSTSDANNVKNKPKEVTVAVTTSQPVVAQAAQANTHVSSSTVTTDEIDSLVKVANASNKAKALASPAVRRVAKELNINIHEVAGSGKKGRVFKEDVVNFSQNNLVSVEPSVANNMQTSMALAPFVNSILVGGTRVEAIRGVKAIMAKAMQNSVTTIPHFTYCEEIDLTELINLRKELKDIYAKQDIKITMMPFFMKAMSLALTEFPIINSQVNDDCSEITYFNDHNIGMAVDSKIGLLVPNVKQVQTKSVLELASDIARLTHDARSGRVQSADLKGGTITISNIGAIGGTIATPIINKPEAAIVALGRVQQLPRFNAQGDVEARAIMQVSWSGDHRIIDGGSIARFCNLWKSYLETPANMMANMR